MDRMEIITRTERRRTYSEAERAAVIAETAVPGVSVRSVSKRRGISESLIYNWRSAQRRAESLAGEPLQFIAYGELPALPGEPMAAPVAPLPVPAPPTPVSETMAPLAEDLIRPHPGYRPGGIDVALPSGVRLSVDSYVNEKALARVLRVLGQLA